MWDDAMNDWFKRERFLSFEKIAAMIQEGDYIDVIENPGRPGQQCALLRMRSYV